MCSFLSFGGLNKKTRKYNGEILPLSGAKTDNPNGEISPKFNKMILKLNLKICL